MALPHVMELLVERQTPGILRMAAVDHVADRAHGSLGLALQGQNLTTAAPAYLWNAAPYILTLLIMIAFSSKARAMSGVPGVLAAGR